jgi:hypothetical protein
MSEGKKDKIDVNELYKKINTGNSAPASVGEVNKFLDENLSESQAKTVKELLADEEKTKAILNSDAAKALFKKFFGGKGNG